MQCGSTKKKNPVSFQQVLLWGLGCYNSTQFLYTYVHLTGYIPHASCGCETTFLPSCPLSSRTGYCFTQSQTWTSKIASLCTSGFPIHLTWFSVSSSNVSLALLISFHCIKKGPQPVCNLRKSHLFCLCFPVPCSWLFRTYIKTENVAFLCIHCAALPSFPNPKSKEMSQEKDTMHVEIFVHLSTLLMSNILSLPIFIIVKRDQNLFLWGKCYFCQWSETAAFKISSAGCFWEFNTWS